MPTYRFGCKTCGEFEREMPMREATVVTRCPHCGTMAARLYTPPYIGFCSHQSQHAVASLQKNGEPNYAVRKLSVSTTQSTHRHTDTGRPWQISHTH
ncbi:FmdB family zinc ribbon protein [Alicyclobacillus hesperidum]|uniref:FmdB family zinc ribbon protein n=1 Tax=Alicyclobacillus hesperidum TaxID=89784 RepID=UPI0009D9B326